jgi:hypothetical protein
MASIRETIGLHCYQYSSGCWYYTVSGRTVGWYMTWGRGSFLEYDQENFRWRSEYESWLIKMLAREFDIALTSVLASA